VRTFEDSTRNTLDLSIVPNVKGLSHLPIIVDPSHATGRPDLIPRWPARGLRRVGRHSHRGAYLSRKGTLDGPQALLPDQYARLMDDLRTLAEALGKTIDACEEVTV